MLDNITPTITRTNQLSPELLFGEEDNASLIYTFGEKCVKAIAPAVLCVGLTVSSPYLTVPPEEPCAEIHSSDVAEYYSVEDYAVFSEKVIEQKFTTFLEDQLDKNPDLITPIDSGLLDSIALLVEGVDID